LAKKATSKKPAKKSKPKRKRSSKKKRSPPKKPSKSTKDSVSGVLVGEITHYFDKIGVGVIHLSKMGLKAGDMITIEGRSTRFQQKVSSMQIESVDVKVAAKGKLIGVKVKKRAKTGDLVYKIK